MDKYAAISVDWGTAEETKATSKNNIFVKYNIISQIYSLNDGMKRERGQQMQNFTCQTRNKNEITRQTNVKAIERI